MKLIQFPNKERLSVKKLHDDLDYWIMIGIGDDIVEIPDQRREYAPFVKKYKNLKDGIPIAALLDLKEEIKRPKLLCKTFYWLLWLEITKLFK